MAFSHSVWRYPTHTPLKAGPTELMSDLLQGNGRSPRGIGYGQSAWSDHFAQACL